MASSNVKWQDHPITRDDRVSLLKLSNKVLWFTGLSGSGKTTLAQELEKKLHQQGRLTYILDGDNIRHGLNGDLGFSEGDRKENLRRIREVAKLLYDAGVTVLVCFISPYQADRDAARKLIGDDFVEVYVKCSLKICEERDVKGLYKEARAGKIKEFTGIDAPFEEPTTPELHIDTTDCTVEESAAQVLDYMGGY